MSLFTVLKEAISSELKLADLNFSYPPSPELGDLSLACFVPAKLAGQNPAELAVRWAEELSASKTLSLYFVKIVALGAYVNFFSRPEYLAQFVLSNLKKQKDKYGFNNQWSGQKIMIEYSNGNTHKEYHIGHLRNICYGDTINKLLIANGCESLPVSYINDFGIHVAKTIWGLQFGEHRNKYDLGTKNLKEKGQLLGQFYAEANQEIEKDALKKEAVSQIMKEIEKRSGANYELWQETRNWSIAYFASVYKELGVKFVHIFYESEEVAEGLQIVSKLIKEGILVKSEGAIIANLEKYGLGVLPIIRSDGTALYPVADLALAAAKFKKYKLNESIYVVDVRQSLYFQQLFKILELMGYQEKMRHLTYDFVTLPEGMVSSRTGQIITYEELRNKLQTKLEEETRLRHEDWTASRIQGAAASLAIATIKFEMLKVNSDKIITFNIEEAAKFEGYTACYLQYGYARLKSIIRKEGLSIFARYPDLSALKEQTEKELLLMIARYPETIMSAGIKYNPSDLAKYLFELVQLGNDYYHSTNILKAEKKIRQARLALVKAVAQVLHNGFDILGIPTIEEM